MRPMEMNQVAPYPEVLAGLVRRLRYKKGWQFTLAETDRGQGSEGLTLTIRITVPDSYHPEQIFNVVHYMIVPPAAYNERSWCRWLLDQILLVEQHEACEFFLIDEHRPYAPNHGPGNNCYTIFDQGFRDDAQTTFRGDHFEVHP
jgi:hypothetical protein